MVKFNIHLIFRHVSLLRKEHHVHVMIFVGDVPVAFKIARWGPQLEVGVSWRWVREQRCSTDRYRLEMGLKSSISQFVVSKPKWVCLKMVYTPNEIAIFHRDNDQQNHWVQ